MPVYGFKFGHRNLSESKLNPRSGGREESAMTQTANQTAAGKKSRFTLWVRRIFSVCCIIVILPSGLVYFFYIYEESDRLQSDPWWLAAHAGVASVFALSAMVCAYFSWRTRPSRQPGNPWSMDG